MKIFPVVVAYVFRVEQARAGVKRGKADEVARQIGLTDKEMARILNLSERTLHRLRPEVLLDNNASERLLLLERFKYEEKLQVKGTFEDLLKIVVKDTKPKESDKEGK